MVIPTASLNVRVLDRLFGIDTIDKLIINFIRAMNKNELQQIREELAGVIEDNVSPQLEEIRGDIGNLKEDVATIKSQMVTKSYLDDKLADLRGDFTVRLRKEDAKVNRLVEIMDSKRLLDRDEVKELNGFQVFPDVSN